MSRIPKKHGTGCPVAFGLDTFGDRWTLLVIRDLMLKGKKTYGDFLKADEHIATNILAARLKHLEAEGIVEKAPNPKNNRSFIYALTEKGRDLAPVILEVVRWSGKYNTDIAASTQVLDEMEADREGLEARMRAAVPKGLEPPSEGG